MARLCDGSSDVLEATWVFVPRHPPAPRTTGRLIFEALAHLRLIPASGNHPPIIPRPPPLQAHLLHLLDVDPTRPP
jgi:hypothetical protein